MVNFLKFIIIYNFFFFIVNYHAFIHIYIYKSNHIVPIGNFNIIEKLYQNFILKMMERRA
jgi:flagellar biosynthesis protein FliR